MQDSVLDFFAKYIETELGMVYGKENYFQLQNRLEEICRFAGFESLDVLYRKAQEGLSGSLKQFLLDVATNNETSFFRDEKLFQAFKSFVISQKNGELFPDQEFKIWSAASSTGQEALSLAMVLNELNFHSYRILGTDISERALEKARKGIYSPLEVHRGLNEGHLQQHFSKTIDEQWRANISLTKNIEFKMMNLKDSYYPYSGFHFIFCRNVLIYQSVESKIDILNKLTSCLVPGGFLVLGSGESLFGLSESYDSQMINGAVVYRKKNAQKRAA